MGLFGKRKKDAGAEPEVAEIDDELDVVDDDAADVQDEPAELDEPRASRYDRAASGPWDESEQDSADLLDLGGLRVPGFDGLELRLELDQESGDVVGITAVAGDSQLQVHPYAAPRTTGVWNEIRLEIADNVRESGGLADPDDGELGTHLDAQLMQQLPGGGTGMVPVRFYGVDGPRWFVRGLLMGQAVSDESARGPLLDWFRGIVVVRGDTPMAPRSPLPMHLPEQVQQPGELVEPLASEAEPETAGDLNPFERGPEITEIR